MSVSWLLLIGMGRGLAFGATPAQAVFAGMMIGPAQVGARIVEASLLNWFHPLVSTRLACFTHPVGACVIGLFGGGAAAAFALLHGAGNGHRDSAAHVTPTAHCDSLAWRLSFPSGTLLLMTSDGRA